MLSHYPSDERWTCSWIGDCWNIYLHSAACVDYVTFMKIEVTAAFRWRYDIVFAIFLSTSP